MPCLCFLGASAPRRLVNCLFKVQAAVSAAIKAIQTRPANELLWSAEQVGEALGVTPRHVTAVLLALPGFPEAHRLPSGAENGGRGRPKWRASEIRSWAEKAKRKIAGSLDFPSALRHFHAKFRCCPMKHKSLHPHHQQEQAPRAISAKCHFLALGPVGDKLSHGVSK